MENINVSDTPKMPDIKFAIGQKVVYSSHGVGEIKDIETIQYGGVYSSFYVVEFIQQRMSLKVPVNKAGEKGLRAMSNPQELTEVWEILKGKASTPLYRGKTTKFIDYKQKLNSGSITDLAELVRDLHKANFASSSYSQKNIYESALKRLADELALLQKVQTIQVLSDLKDLLTTVV